MNSVSVCIIYTVLYVAEPDMFCMLGGMVLYIELVFCGIGFWISANEPYTTGYLDINNTEP